MSEKPFEAARITVWPKAIAANLRAMAALAGKAMVAPVVKADAYGLGLAGVLPALAGHDTFFVARLAEGVALRRLAPAARIFVLDGAPGTAIPALKAHRLVPVLGSLADITGWRNAGGGEAVLHIDTGMNRLGLPPEELALLSAQARTLLANIPLALVMSHLACADDPDAAMNAQQLSRFRAALATLPPAPASLAASGGILLGADYHFDMVRPGLALYGGNPQPARPSPVTAAARLTGTILQLRRIEPGESVGYGAVFRAVRPSLIATVALGYADGVLRVAADGAAMVRGRRAPFAGRVSMDLLTLDVTDIPGVAVGDAAELFGPGLSLDEAARNWGTNAYELLTGLSRRARRVYEGDGRADA